MGGMSELDRSTRHLNALGLVDAGIRDVKAMRREVRELPRKMDARYSEIQTAIWRYLDDGVLTAEEAERLEVRLSGALHGYLTEDPGAG